MPSRRHVDPFVLFPSPSTLGQEAPTPVFGVCVSVVSYRFLDPFALVDLHACVYAAAGRHHVRPCSPTGLEVSLSSSSTRSHWGVYEVYGHRTKWLQSHTAPPAAIQISATIARLSLVCRRLCFPSLAHDPTPPPSIASILPQAECSVRRARAARRPRPRAPRQVSISSRMTLLESRKETNYLDARMCGV